MDSIIIPGFSAFGNIQRQRETLSDSLGACVYLPSEFVLHKAFTATRADLTQMKRSSKSSFHHIPDLDLKPWRI